MPTSLAPAAVASNSVQGALQSIESRFAAPTYTLANPSNSVQGALQSLGSQFAGQAPTYTLANPSNSVQGAVQSLVSKFAGQAPYTATFRGVGGVVNVDASKLTQPLTVAVPSGLSTISTGTGVKVSMQAPNRSIVLTAAGNITDPDGKLGLAAFSTAVVERLPDPGMVSFSSTSGDMSISAKDLLGPTSTRVPAGLTRLSIGAGSIVKWTANNSSTTLVGPFATSDAAYLAAIPATVIVDKATVTQAKEGFADLKDLPGYAGAGDGLALPLAALALLGYLATRRS